METKKRNVAFQSNRGFFTAAIQGGSTTNTTYDCTITGKQETASNALSLWPMTRKLRRNLVKTKRAGWRENLWRLDNQDYGNEFWTWRNYYKGDDLSRRYKWSVKSGLTTYSYDGPLVASSYLVVPTNSRWPTVASQSSQVLLAKSIGTTAIARCLPTNPVADSANFLGELFRDGIPSVIGASMFRDRAFTFKNLGNEYLNIEFGWKPFLSDLQKFAQVVVDHKKILLQLARDSGRGVRRGYRFPTITTSSVTNVNNSVTSPNLVTPMFQTGSNSGTLTTTTTEKVDCWFSGEFRYYLNNGYRAADKIMRCAQEAEKLLGLRITPEVLWNLAPWSWLADWFANIGDVLTNVSMFGHDGLTMRYGYAMVTSDVAKTHTLSGIVLSNGRSLGTLSQTFGTISKVRVKATPYGFGLNPDTQFSARQWAILAALGISRGRLAL